MIAAFGGRDSYISSLNGFGSFHTLGASSPFQALRSLQPCEVLVKANTSGLGIHDLSSSRIIQVGSSNTIIPSADISRLPPVIIASNRHGRLLQGVPSSLELVQMQLKRIWEPSSHFPGFLFGNGMFISSSSFLNVASNAFITQSLEQQSPSSATINLSSSRSLPTTFDPLLVSVGLSSQLLNAGRLKADSQSAVPLTSTSIVSFTNNDDLSKYLDNFPISQRGNNPQSISSTVQDPFIGRDAKYQAMLLPKTIDGETNFLNFRSTGNSKQRAPKEEGTYEQKTLFNSRSIAALCTTFASNSVPGNQRANSHHNTSCSIFSSNCQIGKSTAESLREDKREQEIMKVQEGTELSGCCLDDVVGSLIKSEKGHISLSQNDSESDMHQFDACM